MKNTIMYMTEKFYEVIDVYTDADIEDDAERMTKRGQKLLQKKMCRIGTQNIWVI